MGRIIGIDLGTTNSLACFWDNGKVTMIPNSFGDYLTPSVVSFDKDKSIYVGQTAKERRVTHPDSTFENFKRYMGRMHTFECFAGTFSAEELSALVLSSLKDDAERFLGERVTEAVISVPAYFDNKARSATKRAGELAGLKVERIINEPSAAALGFILREGGNLPGEDEKSDGNEEIFEEKSFLIFDFGGGTLDVSLVDTFDNIVEIISVSGDNRLGGIDFDKCIADYFIKENELNPEDLGDKGYQIVLAAAERVKRQLSEEASAAMVISYGDIRASMVINDVELAKICVPVLQRIYTPVNNVLRDSSRNASSLSDVIMVGGSSKMPVVQEYLKHLLKRRDMDVYHPDMIVAEGMGVYAGIKERNTDVKDMILTDVCPFSLGTNINNKEEPGKDLSSVIIERNSPLPISRTRIYYPIRENQLTVTFRIFQGEEKYADDNRRVGMVNVTFQKAPGTKTKIYLTFTYDINGILLVNADVPDYNMHIEAAFSSTEEVPDEKSKAEIVHKLKAFKAVPKDDEDNRMLMEWGERLYVQLPPVAKDSFAKELQFFEYILDKDPYQVSRMQRHIKQYFSVTEEMLNNFAVSGFDTQGTWEEDEGDLENLFKEWEQEGKDDKK